MVGCWQHPPSSVPCRCHAAAVQQHSLTLPQGLSVISVSLSHRAPQKTRRPHGALQRFPVSSFRACLGPWDWGGRAGSDWLQRSKSRDGLGRARINLLKPTRCAQETMPHRASVGSVELAAPPNRGLGDPRRRPHTWAAALGSWRRAGGFWASDPKMPYHG